MKQIPTPRFGIFSRIYGPVRRARSRVRRILNTRKRNSYRSSGLLNASGDGQAAKSWMSVGETKSLMCATGSHFPLPNGGGKMTANSSTIRTQAENQAD